MNGVWGTTFEKIKNSLYFKFWYVVANKICGFSLVVATWWCCFFFFPARLPQRTIDACQIRRHVQDVLPLRQCGGILRSRIQNFRYGQKWIYWFQGEYHRSISVISNSWGTLFSGGTHFYHSIWKSLVDFFLCAFTCDWIRLMFDCKRDVFRKNNIY